ncbi:hypothetical protein D3C77_607710 [compost metagenome]
MRRRLVAVDLGPRVHHQLFCTSFGKRKCAVQGTVRAVEAKTHLGGYRNMRRNRTAHFAQDGVEQLRLLEQHRPTPGFVHRLGWATKVEVDYRRP